MHRMTRTIFLVIALVAASIISYTLYHKLNEKQTGKIVAPSQETVEIAVALKPLGRGDKIEEQDLRLASYLKATAPVGNFPTLAQLVGRVVLKEIKTTEPVLESALAPLDVTKGGMAALIQSQKRAMAVKVDDVIGVAGFLQPGHLVDVLVSLEKPGEKRRQITKTVLENIPVLSIGTQAEESNEKKAKKVTVVTLEVDLEEAEKLALAVNQGRIQLALRGYTDNDQVLTKGTTVSSLLKSYATASNRPVKVAKTAPKPAKKPRFRPQLVIEVMNGNNVSRLNMDRHQ
ncbi:Flp pilus assembly protein CpaB [Desulfogranum mediterraneum]|uniref:Flp pilus assembly protein CpaB n=1 Tax=Desulfogranum mediterraneum TaxID=160661 RepID=UPI0005502F3B|nr:Flp pilus assembly protein CpaB [Desulfogranum mediterraneum]